MREAFLDHVIGGKHLSSRPGFVEMVRGPTPDVVLSGVEVLARLAGDVVVVDVGGATTDVHSVVDLDPEDGALAREVVAPTAVTRTVEADLGMRWSAVSTAAASERPDLEAAAAVRTADPSFLPATDADRDDDEQIAGAAAGLALRRHAGRSRVVVSPEGRVVERSQRRPARGRPRGALGAARSGTGGRGWPSACWPAARRRRARRLAAARAPAGRRRRRLRARRRRPARGRPPGRGRATRPHPRGGLVARRLRAAP